MNYLSKHTCKTKEDYDLSLALQDTFEYILDNKPEYITNPYKKSRKINRTHKVSDMIESINNKIQKSDIIQDEFSCIDEDGDSCFEQLTFDFK